MTEFDDRLDEHRRRVASRLDRIRAAHGVPGGRDLLRGMRRAASSTRPRRPSPRRIPAITIASIASAVLLALYIVERAS